MTPRLDRLRPAFATLPYPSLQSLELGQGFFRLFLLFHEVDSSRRRNATNRLDFLLVDGRIEGAGQRSELPVDLGILEPVKGGRDLGRVGRR